MNQGPDQQVSWQELSKSECFSLLARQCFGRVSFIDKHGPTMLPVNFLLDRHTVVFRTDAGAKLDAALRHGRVAFEVDDVDVASHTGWSVLIRGEATEVTGPQELARLRRLIPDPWAPGAKPRYVRILPAMLTGRRIAASGAMHAAAAPQPDKRR